MLSKRAQPGPEQLTLSVQARRSFEELHMKPHRGVIILVFGILGLVACQLFGVAAWVMGNQDLREMDAGWMDPSGRDMTNAGRICGMIASALLIIPVIFILVMLVLSAARNL